MADWLSSLTPYEVLSAAWLVWALTAVVGILVQRRPPVATLAWTLALLLLPVVGALIYLGFGPRRMVRRRLRYLAAADEAVQATLERVQATRTFRPFEGRLACRQLATLVDRLGEGRPVRADAIELFDEGDRLFAAMDRAIREARDHVHVEYYIWDRDAVGEHFRDLLCERARAGVAVRVLLDGVGAGLRSGSFWTPLLEAGGELAWFNAFRLLRWRAHLFNFRTHRKLVVCDGHVGFVGGINVSARQCAEHAGDQAWRDSHVQVRGEPVRRLQRLFLEDWYFANESLRPQPEQIERFFPRLESAAGPWTQVIGSGPDNGRAAIARFYFAAISSAVARVWITTPYFVPDEEMLAALTSAALRGVDVQLLVPLRGDSRLVSAASRSFYDEVALAGVRVHEYLPRMLHAKTMVVDDDIALVGTANMDNRSFRLNFEVVVVIYDRQVNGELAAHFRRDLASAQPWHRPSRQRLRRLSVWYGRFLDSLARLFSPLL